MENKELDPHKQILMSFQQFTIEPSGKDSRTSDCCGSTAHQKRLECFRSNRHPISMKIFHSLLFMHRLGSSSSLVSCQPMVLCLCTFVCFRFTRQEHLV
ncbi:uncharacterized protein TNIN_193481 [Trichonephila inaurata madagascariensis]|uniref:Uncharacterized protein n=1 Tax=Trichonephila inaurata madagascariensis TaxID=2747483 RepID=A0A8X6XN71_9ARAC|nr:uncharacterized protein TNIN_193481 [Trichonephila inaurata madagascariensis]